MTIAFPYQDKVGHFTRVFSELHTRPVVPL
jgi:hypothetical protein